MTPPLQLSTGSRATRATLVVASALILLATASAAPAWRVVGGDARRGAALIEAYGCAGCHTVPGIRNANGNVGPPLTRFGDRTYIAGVLRNTPENLVRWIRVPQSVLPGNAMPDMGVTDAQARDIAAYLYTLR
ncbi:MAG: c-type cytochrome [Pseudomonadota bacterium]|nr:c-type cytochrome [Pseudomonadota bacterium]